MLFPLPAATQVTVADAFPLSKLTVAALVLPLVALLVPLQLPQSISKLLVGALPLYVNVPDVGFNVIVQVPLLTVNVYVLLALL